MNQTNASWFRRHPLASFYLLTLGICWLGWIPHGASKAGLISLQIPEDVIMFFQYGPSLAALLMSAALGGRAAVGKLLAAAVHWRVGFQWYVVVLFITPFAALCAVGLRSLLGAPAPDFSQLGQCMARWAENLQSASPSIGLFTTLGEFSAGGWWQSTLVFAVFAIANGGLSEEFGWRGYALPRLLTKRKALTASAIVALLWTFYHTDSDFWQIFLTRGPIAFALLVPNLLSELPLSVLMTWVYVNTQGSLLLPILFHASYNSTITILRLAWGKPGDVIPAFSAETVLGLWVVAILVVFRFGAARLSRTPVSETSSVQ